jgi:predicted aldo/keto reductase-like oxidoreductase
MPADHDGHYAGIERRTFLQQVALGGAAIGAASGLSAVAPGVLEAAADPAVKQHRLLGSTDIRMSDISFGGSRLRGDADLVRYALDKGINYFDTAESYTGGNSETVIGQALKGKRDQVYIVSKGGFGSRVRQDEMMRSLEGSLRRLRTDYVDVYFHHAVNDVGRIRNPEFHAFTERAREQGKIRYVGLSGHGGRLIECLDYAIDSGRFDVMLVAYNFGQDPSFVQRLTRSFDFIAINPDLPRVLRKAKEAGMGVVAMKTLRGAKLNDMEPYQKEGATFSQAAFRWVLSNNDVDGMIVTMRSRSDIDEFLVASGGTKVTQRDVDLLQRYVTLNDSTYCRPLCDACEASCPENVQIADVLRHKMYFEDYGAERMAMERYAKLTHNASSCAECTHQRCLGACPYGLSIPELTRQAHRLLHWG